MNSAGPPHPGQAGRGLCRASELPWADTAPDRQGRLNVEAEEALSATGIIPDAFPRGPCAGREPRPWRVPGPCVVTTPRGHDGVRRGWRSLFESDGLRSEPEPRARELSWGGSPQVRFGPAQ